RARQALMASGCAASARSGDELKSWLVSGRMRMSRAPAPADSQDGPAHRSVVHRRRDRDRGTGKPKLGAIRILGGEVKGTGAADRLQLDHRSPMTGEKHPLAPLGGGDQLGEVRLGLVNRDVHGTNLVIQEMVHKRQEYGHYW